MGLDINLDKYIEVCKVLKEADPTLTEIFALDVIGDHKATKRNTERMWKAGVEAIPAFHIGEPKTYLKHLGNNYPKIALGGMADLRGRTKLHWAEACFAVVWPKPIHGFGASTEQLLLELPWHSTDASSWHQGPHRFGVWKRFGKLSNYETEMDMRAEIEYWLDLERKARVRWMNDMPKLGQEWVAGANAIRLSVAMIESKYYPERCRLAFGEPPNDRRDNLPDRLSSAGLFFEAGGSGADSRRGRRGSAP